MAPTPPPESITLKVKVPPGHLTAPAPLDGSSGPSPVPDSFELGRFAVSATIGSVRQAVQQTVPSNPSPTRQRLLYGGRALVDDEQTLADALNTKRDTSQTEYVVHLLVKGEGMNTTPHAHLRSESATAATGTSSASLPQASTSHPTSQTGSDAPQVPPRARLQWDTLAESTRRILLQMHPEQRREAEARILHRRAIRALPPQLRPPSPARSSSDSDNEAALASFPGGGPQPNTAQQTQQGSAARPQSQGPAQRRPLSGQGFHIEGVGPNGQRFAVHQQTVNFGAHIQHGAFGQPLPMPMPFAGHMPHTPHMGQQQIPGMLPGFPMLPPQLGLAGTPQAQNQPPSAGPSQRVQSALDRARDNISEARRMLDEVRDSSADISQEERRRRYDDIRRRMDEVNNYIDPLNLGNNTARTSTAGSNDTTGRRSAPPVRSNGNLPQYSHNELPWPSMLAGLHTTQPSQNPPPPNDVTAYLLSGPQGPHAILFSLQHGVYRGGAPPTHLPSAGLTMPQYLRQRTAHPAPGAQQPQQPAAQPANQPAPPGDVGQQGGAAAGAQELPGPQDPLGPLQPFLAPLWLLLRILIFSYFLLGTNMGYTRPLILMSIGMIFWAIRMGLLGDGAAVRRWWEGVVGAPVRPQPENQPLIGAVGNAEGPQPVDAEEARRRAATPQDQRRQDWTPEQAARRILDEQAARQRERRTWLREQIRPVERAVALFVASLWPGIGEAHVRAQRRLREEQEVERRRVEEEERRRRREEEEAKTKQEGSDEVKEGVRGENAAEDSGSGSGSASKEAVASGSGEKTE